MRFDFSFYRYLALSGGVGKDPGLQDGEESFTLFIKQEDDLIHYF